MSRQTTDGDLQQVDFAAQTEPARKTINAWVESKTKDKIKELIKPGMLDSMTRLVLTNAIYFKGKWASQFKPERTEDSPFILLGGQKVNVLMMNQTGKFGYMEDANDIQVLEMPYVNNDLSMVILLPKKADGVKDLEKELDTDNLAGWLDKIHKREVQVFFPRFKMTSEFELGQGARCDGNAGRLFSKGGFFRYDRQQGTFHIGCGSQGIRRCQRRGNRGSGGDRRCYEINLGRRTIACFQGRPPVYFFIRDNQTGSILFLGRVANPASQDN